MTQAPSSAAEAPGASDPRPVPPEPPQPGACCESGCDPCVHDLYAEELAEYRRQLASWLERHPQG